VALEQVFLRVLWFALLITSPSLPDTHLSPLRQVCDIAATKHIVIHLVLRASCLIGHCAGDGLRQCLCLKDNWKLSVLGNVRRVTLQFFRDRILGRLSCSHIWQRCIAINVSKSITELFVKAARSIQKPRAVQFLGQQIQWVETARVILDTRLTLSAHVSRVGSETAQRLSVHGSCLNKRSGVYVRKGVLFGVQPCLEAASASHCD
jgi:hypothetical protein